MKVELRCVIYLDESNVPSEYNDPEYLEEVLTENIEDVFLGAGINKIDIDYILIEKKE